MLTAVVVVVSLLFAVAYLFANHFDRARFVLILIGQTTVALGLALAVNGYGIIGTALLSLAFMAWYLGAFYPHRLSMQKLHYWLSSKIAPTVNAPMEQDFGKPMQDIYQGRPGGWYLGAWGAKGPPQANFTIASDHVVLHPGDQAYFEYMPATLERPVYLNLHGGQFKITVKEIEPITANGTLHLFICGGRTFSSYYHRDPIEVGSEWATHRRSFNPAEFVLESGHPDIGAAKVLSRIGYIGIMYISPENRRTGVNFQGLLGIKHFAYWP